MKCFEAVRDFPGNVGLYYRALGQAREETHNPDLPLVAASVIKIPIMVTAFRDIAAGELDENEIVTIKREDKMPSCGALTYMHDGLEVTLSDLITLMIILSDNTATNLLIDRLTPDHVNRTMEDLNIPGIALRRRLFEPELSARGIQNTVTARGIGTLLERMATGTLLGKDVDERMIDILLNQRLNGKLPFYLHGKGIRCAHKTGEDDDITHDVGIIYTERPFVLCMLSNGVDVPAFERLMQDTARALAFGECAP
ncbi:MAG: serine hydrolase [Clostridia bacterium]|nr:serine hydrolase [Clostridia bacterium]